MPSLTRSLALGLLCALPLFNSALAAPTQARDNDAPRSAIAIKLNKAASRARSVAGAEVIEDLIRKAQSGSGLAKRDSQFNVLPLITSLSNEQLEELVQRAVANDQNYKPVDFGAWYQVQFPESTADEGEPEVLELLTSLAGYEEVASAQKLAQSAKSPAVQPSDDPMYVDQGYLTGGGVGIDAVYAWGFPGGDGAGTTVIDIEAGWDLTHEDLVAQGITLVGNGMNVKDRYGGNWPHGTAVLGEMLMTDNAIGGVGIVPSAQGHVVGVQRTVNGAPVINEAEAILEAAAFLSPGDVMVLEMQTGDTNGDLWPIEILDAQYDAIVTATAAGIIVIEPASNGGMDLSQPVTRFGETAAHSFLDPTHADFRDSGAIMVGASSSASPHTKMSWSDYGSRVDVFSWGENIWTTSSKTDDWSYDDIYVEFSGTSGASPIVAGAALSIQGMLAANGNPKLTPAAMRTLIKVGGTASANPATDLIGVQPNLKAIIDGGHLL